MRLFERLIDATVPTIAAVAGPVRAGGIGLMASCDLVVVRSDVTFAFSWASSKGWANWRHSLTALLKFPASRCWTLMRARVRL